MINTDIDKEKAILSAATKLFLEKGFAATSTTQIAKEAGCNQALVHYYFRTKDRLFEAVFANKFQAFISNIVEISEGDMTFEEKLRLKIESHFDMLMANPKLPLMLAYELNTNPKRIDKMKEKLGDLPAKFFTSFQAELDAEIEKGSIRKMKVIDLLFTIVALNLALFVVGPVLKNFAGISDEYYEGFIKHRKNENVNMILRSLRP